MITRSIGSIGLRRSTGFVVSRGVAPAAALLLVGLSPAIAATTYGPSAYTSASSSPFASLSFSSFYLEDFEDGLLNTLGASSLSGVVVNPGTATDSVDADDGTIDGLGQNGRSYYSNQQVTTMVFTFSAGALGGLPTHAGIVWTDVGQVADGLVGIAEVEFRAFDSANLLIATILAGNQGDGNVNGGTAEDRFLGVDSAAGIARIEISMPFSVDWEVDHLQYGIIPAPGAAMLLVAPVVLSGTRRRPR